jgi:hypothetical protein
VLEVLCRDDSSARGVEKVAALSAVGERCEVRERSPGCRTPTSVVARHTDSRDVEDAKQSGHEILRMVGGNGGRDAWDGGQMR